MLLEYDLTDCIDLQLDMKFKGFFLPLKVVLNCDIFKEYGRRIIYSVPTVFFAEWYFNDDMISFPT